MKSVVLLSSGLDSTVNIYQAQKESEVVLALTFNYGQRAFQSEVRQARKISDRLRVKHLVVDLPFFKEWGKSSLTDHSKAVPVSGSVSIDNYETSVQTAKSVWVPNRNGVFLNIAAGFAESLGADWVIPGFNREEASTFPDNSQDFLEQCTRSLSFSTSNQVQVKCFTVDKNKTEIVGIGKSLNVDFSLIWPCYFNHDTRWCGQCESCQRSIRALKANNIDCSLWIATTTSN